MDKNEIYETIFRRKSIRKYDQDTLDEEILKDIQGEVMDLKPLIPGIKTEVLLISSEDVKTRMMKKAPHYLAVFSEEKEGYLTNVGYMLQQMDLLFSANGIGCCWQGIPTIKDHVKPRSELKFVILLAFGNPDEPLHRSDISEFKRNPIEKMTDITITDENREILEAGRLSPTATNSQAWFLSGDDSCIDVFTTKPNFIRSLIAKKYIPIDAGIVIYQIMVAATHFKQNPEVVFKEGIEKKGYIYCASINLNPDRK
ncbi:nitroreductase [Methanobacterium lacus]|uniref:Nitroreductase n=1 Tax=Methanobacterium lacus (strain AL-21) TaxID=877455 RepID=F0TB46_METLA|nr:nitroreductase family protein [Methanobacterium lacus]ADZ10192.1 nitroreductase [Methanobacterium lacus]